MELYFLPLACSLATRISLYEAGADANYIEVDRMTKLTPGGQPFREINPLGLVPVIRTDDGELLTENAAILQYVADRYPAAELAPPNGGLPRNQLQRWLSFIGTELHKGLFVPLLGAGVPEGARSYALDKGTARLDYLQDYLTGREFLLERFSVADAYLVTVLSWSRATPIRLKQWPVLRAYLAHQVERPSVARAFAEERPLYDKEIPREQT